MVAIKNKTELVKKGENSLTQKARQLALDCLEYAVNALDPKKIVTQKLAYRGDLLIVGDHVFDLTKVQNVYVVGGGKATGAIAEALEQVMSDRISEGTVNVPYDTEASTRIIELHEAKHPLPDESGVEGTKKYLKLRRKPKQMTW